MSPELSQKINDAHASLVSALVRELGANSHWVGELSSSALSTATAVTALSELSRTAHADLIRNGTQWLAGNQNADGGWGDTVRSRSNLSTTALCWAAFGAAHADGDFKAVIERAERYIAGVAGSLDNVVPAIEARYGDDRTFSVPITMMLALSGRLGPDGWRRVRPLPFELAALPRGLFGALRLPVVSYALPALIAIGQVIHFRARRINPLRRLTSARTLDVLTMLQPENGGFLEATPLTSFVTMSLAGMGQGRHVVAQRGAAFLRDSVRPDGSWPIDTNLATWVTTLSVKALRYVNGALTGLQRCAIREWLLGQQHVVEHPYTGAAPGGWAWTDLPGGVPDADDTAGALAALDLLRPTHEARDVALQFAAANGVQWLLGLQNRDGGIPTFCRGWGTLPFDRSTPELTAHALRGWTAWLPSLDERLAPRTKAAIDRALLYLQRSQRADGSWIPLWFGNEHAPEEENPVYGTAQVLIGLENSGLADRVTDAVERARGFLEKNQNADGGWGGALNAPSTVEETSLAVEALASGSPAPAERGAEWLVRAVEQGTWRTVTPIGLYFARLWYFERLYPLIFATSALGAVRSKRA